MMANTTIIISLGFLVIIVLMMIYANKLDRLFLTLMVILLPFSHAAFMPRELGGIPGANPTNFIWLMGFFFMLISLKTKSYNAPETKFFTVALVIFFTFYTIALLRSITDINSIAPYIKENKPTVNWLIMNRLLKPLQFISTGWIIAKYCAATKNVTTVKKALLLLPCLILPVALAYYFIGATQMPTHGIEDPEYYGGRDMLSASIGMHANGLGGLAVVLLGFILSAHDIQWKKFRYISMACCLGLIIISLSRMAFIATAIIALLEFRHFNKKERILLITIMGVLILSTSSLLLSRLYYGIENVPGQNSTNADQISAGRIESIWQPSIPQFMKNPVFGSGLLSIWKGPANKTRMLPSHPHNAYFEVLLDMGIVGLISLAGFVYSLWNKSKQSRALRLGLLTWLCMALTGNSFYPFYYNMIIWVIYGMACAETSLTHISAAYTRKPIKLQKTIAAE